jgi:nucleoside-triphosphatase THEP1
MTQKEKLMRWFEFNNFVLDDSKYYLSAKKDVLIRSTNHAYRIIIEWETDKKLFKFELKCKYHNSISFVSLKTDYISIFEWETKVKDILTKSKLIRSFRMAEPKVKVTQDEVTEVTEVTNDTVAISVEDAKRILQAEEQKQNLKMEQCKTEIEEILKKYEVDLVTVIDKPAVSKLVNEFLTNEKANYFILHPEIRNLQNVQSQEA